MLKNILLIILSLSYIYATEKSNSNNINYENEYYLWEQYRNDFTEWLIDTSKKIDDYFIDDEEIKDINVTNKTYAKLTTSFAKETGGSAFEYALNFRLRLNLPKIQEHLRIVFEDEDEDEERKTLEGEKFGQDRDLENKDYHLRIEYFNYIKNRIKFSGGGGIRIRNFLTYPYVNLKAKYKIHKDDNSESQLYDRIRWYVDGKLENVFQYSYKQTISKGDKLYGEFNSKINYDNKKEMEDFITTLSILKIINQKENISTGINIINKLNSYKIEYLDYTQYYISYKETFYKDWLYYQLTPSILWRTENDFDKSYRIVFTLGVIFK